MNRLCPKDAAHSQPSRSRRTYSSALIAQRCFLTLCLEQWISLNTILNRLCTPILIPIEDFVSMGRSSRSGVIFEFSRQDDKSHQCEKDAYGPPTSRRACDSGRDLVRLATQCIRHGITLDEEGSFRPRDERDQLFLQSKIGASGCSRCKSAAAIQTSSATLTFLRNLAFHRFSNDVATL